MRQRILRKRVRGVNHPDTIITMTNLANVYEYQKKIDQVEKIREESLTKSIAILKIIILIHLVLGII